MQEVAMTEREALAVAGLYRRERDAARGAMAALALLKGQELSEAGRIEAANFVQRSAVYQFMQRPGIQNGLARVEQLEQGREILYTSSEQA